MRRWRRWGIPAVLLLLAVLPPMGLRAVPAHGAADWPSLRHPLGIDVLGRDFLGVLAHGAADFVGPGLFAVLLLLCVLAGRCLLATRRPVLDPAPASDSAWFLLAAPPRLLLVMVAMLLFDEPSPWVAAAVVLGLYLPIALDETTTRLRDLAEGQVLAGLVAHGLSPVRIACRHLLFGHLRDAASRHAAMLFVQVAFTQIALSWVFGAAATTPGLGVSWGMEFKRYTAQLPTTTTVCLPDVACAPYIAALHAVLLLAVCVMLLGGLLRETEE